MGKGKFFSGILLTILLAIYLPSGSVLALSIKDLPVQKTDHGANVVLVQQRLVDLGYLNFRVTGNFGDMTKTAVQWFQRRNNITLHSGIVDEATYQALCSKDVVRVGSGVVPLIAGPRTVSPTVFGTKTPWAEVNKTFADGTTGVIVDLYTGQKFSVIRTGGENHATVQTLTAEDHATYIKCFGGIYTWEKRPVLVSVGGATYAASLFGMPNGAANTVPDKGAAMPGSTALYFFESTSDMGGIMDVEHVDSIEIAAGAVSA